MHILIKKNGIRSSLLPLSSTPLPSSTAFLFVSHCCQYFFSGLIDCPVAELPLTFTYNPWIYSHCSIHFLLPAYFFFYIFLGFIWGIVLANNCWVPNVGVNNRGYICILKEDRIEMWRFTIYFRNSNKLNLYKYEGRAYILTYIFKGIVL